MARNQAFLQKYASAIETALGATKRSWPGATESAQISLTVLALTSRKLTLASTPTDGDAPPISFSAFPSRWQVFFSLQHSGSPGPCRAQNVLPLSPVGPIYPSA